VTGPAAWLFSRVLRLHSQVLTVPKVIEGKQQNRHIERLKPLTSYLPPNILLDSDLPGTRLDPSISAAQVVGPLYSSLEVKGRYAAS
jgi:hypothetical protein